MRDNDFVFEITIFFLVNSKHRPKVLNELIIGQSHSSLLFACFDDALPSILAISMVFEKTNANGMCVCLFFDAKLALIIVKNAMTMVRLTKFMVNFSVFVYIFFFSRFLRRKICSMWLTPTIISFKHYYTSIFHYITRKRNIHYHNHWLAFSQKNKQQKIILNCCVYCMLFSRYLSVRVSMNIHSNIIVKYRVFFSWLVSSLLTRRCVFCCCCFCCCSTLSCRHNWFIQWSNYIKQSTHHSIAMNERRPTIY